MAGTYLSKRVLPLLYDDVTIYRRRDKAPFLGSVQRESGEVDNSHPSSQETTSYRSRGDEFSVIAPVSALGSWKAAINELSDTDSSTKRGAAHGQHDSGHPFSTIKRRCFLSHKSFYVQGGDGSWFQGALWPSQWGGYPNYRNDVAYSKNPAINSLYYGPLAISLTTPTSPQANLTGAALELLRDGVPGAVFGKSASFVKSSVKTNNTGSPGNVSGMILNGMKAAAGDYLNFQFAITPLLADLTRVFQAVVSSKTTLDQLYKDSGKNVRRRLHFPRSRTSTLLRDSVSMSYPLNNHGNGASQNYSYYYGFDPSLPTNQSQSPIGRTGSTSWTLNREEHYWFSGAYTYYFGDVNNIDQINVWARDADKILGLGVTAEVLWNAAPWSWLVDWMSNIGVNVKNWTNFSQDGLVLRYGYLMRTCKSVYVHTARGMRFYNDVNPGTVTLKYDVTSKERVKATPFGFGSNPNTWSARQWAILASLGMTRSPRVAF